MNELVLIVEDAKDTVELLRYNLDKEGYRTVTAQNGEEAIIALQMHSPDLMLLDIMLPGLNGWETCEALRSKGVAIPIVILSALSAKDDQIKGLTLGTDDYLPKPFSVKELVLRVKRLLEKGLKSNRGETVNKYISEFIGTFALVFAGTGAIIVNDLANGAVSHVGISLTFGLIVMAMIYSIGDISGAHLNPAVTFSFWVKRSFPGRQVLPYVVSQCAGAISASATLHYLFAQHPTLGATLPSGTPMQSFVLEIIMTFFLVFVILNVATDAKEKGLMAGVAIGATVALDALFGGPVSGASMNPARSLAPALMSGHIESLWVYLTAPFIGGLLAVLVCGYLVRHNAP